MSKHVLAPQFLLCFVIACVAFPLVYVTLATKGETWVYSSLVIGQRAAFILCCATGMLAIADRSKRSLLGVVFAAVICVLGPFPGQIDCAFGGLSGGYYRITNCGYDIAVYAGFIALIFAMVSSLRSAAYLAVMLAVGFPIGVLSAHFFLTAKLRQTLVRADLRAECVIRQPVRDYYTPELSGSERVQRVEDLQLNWIIGENSPRIYKVLDGIAHIWKYQKQSFVQSNAGAHLVVICEGDKAQG